MSNKGAFRTGCPRYNKSGNYEDEDDEEDDKNNKRMQPIKPKQS